MSDVPTISIPTCRIISGCRIHRCIEIVRRVERRSSEDVSVDAGRRTLRDRSSIMSVSLRWKTVTTVPKYTLLPDGL